MNDDWEDLTSDNENFYVANSGNNYGERKDLSILILDKKINLDVMGKLNLIIKIK